MVRMSNLNTNDNADAGASFSAPTVAAPIRGAGSIEPEFIAMPGPGQVCPYSGLKRGALYALAREGVIRTVTLRRRNTTRGRRLIVLATLKAYLRGLDAVQNKLDRE
jgi:hypothetical protein